MMLETLRNSKNTRKTRAHEDILLSPDKRELWFESTISLIYDKNDVLDYFKVVSVAINQRKIYYAKDLLLKEIHQRLKTTCK